MTLAIDIGGGSSLCAQWVPVYISPGGTTTITNITASANTVNYSNAPDGSSAGTITAGNNISATTPTWIYATGPASLTFSGTGY